MTQTQIRTQKLLILAGDQSPNLQSRDYTKLHQIIIGQYIPQNKPSYIQFFLELLPSLIRRVPLKQHIYSALIGSLHETNSELSLNVLRQVVINLQNDLNSLRLHESINGIVFLAQLMNLEILNSQCFFDVLDDVVGGMENCKNVNRGFFVTLFSRTLAVSAYSLNKKVYFQFKKLLQRAKKYCHKNPQFTQILQNFQKNSLSDNSNTPRLFQSPPEPPTSQIQQKMRLKINIPQNLKYCAIEYHIPHPAESDKQYQQYLKNESWQHIANIQQMIQLMKGNSTFMLSKLNTYITHFSTCSPLTKPFLIDLLLGKALRSKTTIIQSYQLIHFIKLSTQYAQLVINALKNMFKNIDSLVLGELIKFAEVVSYLVYSWADGAGGEMVDCGGWDWGRFLGDGGEKDGRDGRDSRDGREVSLSAKKSVVLRIILEKIMLLSDSVKVPANLKKYAPSQDVRNPPKYKSVQQLQTLQLFECQLKKKSPSNQLQSHIKSDTDYQIFLFALFQKTSQSHTHLQILLSRYQQILKKYKEDNDWILLNSIRVYWSKSLFHRLLYLGIVIERGYVQFGSYVKFISKVVPDGEEDDQIIKIQLNQLVGVFGAGGGD